MTNAKFIVGRMLSIMRNRKEELERQKVLLIADSERLAEVVLEYCGNHGHSDTGSDRLLERHNALMSEMKETAPELDEQKQAMKEMREEMERKDVNDNTS